MSPWSVGVPSVTAAAPAWSLSALDAFPPILDDNLHGVASFLDDTTRSAAGVLPPAANVLPGVEPSLP